MSRHLTMKKKPSARKPIVWENKSDKFEPLQDWCWPWTRLRRRWCRPRGTQCVQTYSEIKYF